MFEIVFVAVLSVVTVVKLWLAGRQIRHVAQHADRVPEQFAGRIEPAAHRRAAHYTIARQRLGLIEIATGTAVLLMLTLLGGLDAIARVLADWIGRGFAFQVLIVASVVLLLAVIDLPFAWVRQFRIEAAFGFNRMTPRLFVLDTLKAATLAAVLGLPLLALVLWLMEQAGALWWLYAWLAWMGFNALILVLYPAVIAPLFNRFEPLADAALARRVEDLLARTGFSARGVFVMDGSRRSSHGNAYFTGLGSAKRIVFFDTLIERLAPAEIEAVLAHELGHYL